MPRGMPRRRLLRDPIELPPVWQPGHDQFLHGTQMIRNIERKRAGAATEGHTLSHTAKPGGDHGFSAFPAIDL